MYIKESRAKSPCSFSGGAEPNHPQTPTPKKAFLGFFIKMEIIKIIDMDIIIIYNKSTKKHTIFSTERSVFYVSCKEHGCKG